jgi:TonB family protein
MNAVLIRGDWVGQLIDERYPLLEWLGGSGGSAVFLTELAGEGSQRVAIKLLPVSPRAEDRFSRWAAAASLSHPRLGRILHYGRAEVENVTLVYVVTEHAEEILSQIIPDRSLSADEARAMLNPVLDALEYLHKSGFVHGHLKPSNILVIENEIKLSSDSLLPVGKPAPELLTNDIHIAPETASNPVATPADIWSLGMTLVEALTQQLPIWDVASDAEPIIPTSVPPPFSDIARNCLHTDPARRCRLTEIRDLLETEPAAAAPAPPPLSLRQPTLDDKELPSKRPLIALALGLMLLVTIIIAFQMHSRKKTDTAPLSTETTLQPQAAEPDSTLAATEAQRTAPSGTATPAVGSQPASGDVLIRDIPQIPHSASSTIHGTVVVVVRVSVDATGVVTDAKFASEGPSAYFARRAIDSARNWKFKPSQQRGDRSAPHTWLLHYRFRRDGVEVTRSSVGTR